MTMDKLTAAQDVWRTIARLLTGSLLFYLSFHASAKADGIIPVGRPEFNFIYDRLERQEALSSTAFRYTAGPVWFNETELGNTPFSDIVSSNQRQIIAFGALGEHFGAARSLKSFGYERIAAGGSAQPIKNLQLFANFRLDEQLAKSPDYTGKKWRGLAGEVENAFVHYHHDMFDITAGRYAQFWGPRNSLVLSSQTTLDGLAYAFHWGRLSLSYRLARLNSFYPERDSVLATSNVENENRYFAGHRLDVRVSNNLNIALFETVIFGGPGRQIDLYYLNPILFYHSAQLNDGADDNTLLGFDITARPMKHLKVYGQLLVDDFQLDRKTQADEEPDQFGVLFGGYFAKIFSQTDFQWEYTRVTNWTFNQPKPRNRYVMNNIPIGGASGNDYDQFTFSVIRWLRDDLHVSFDYSIRQQGEGSITAEWTEPWMDVEGDYNESFPTGVVENTTMTGFGLTGYVTSFLYLNVDAGMEWVRNVNHVDGAHRTSPFIRANIATFFLQSIGID